MGAERLMQQLQPADRTAAPVTSAFGKSAMQQLSAGRESLQDKKPGNTASSQSEKGRFDRNECQTCKNRRYQDGSNDPGVSFKTPGKIDPSVSQSRVRAHEYEHVFRERSKALREGREVVSQSVMLQTGICPECGRAYISGGTTRTVTRKSEELDEILAAREENAADRPDAQPL